MDTVYKVLFPQMSHFGTFVEETLSSEPPEILAEFANPSVQNSVSVDEDHGRPPLVSDEFATICAMSQTRPLQN
jgi:hypothetical protein